VRFRLPHVTAGLAVVLLLGFAPAAFSQRVSAVEAVGITVSDLDRAVEFYTGVLSFEKLGEEELYGEALEHLTGVFGARVRVARLRLGEEQLELTEYLAPKGRPIPPGLRGNDRSFQHVAIIVSDMQAAYRHLRAHKVEHASTGPQRLPDWNPAAGGIEAFYFRDPDGHFLEVLHFPPGKGLPKWQARDRLFLGIDHTAIVVADTESSLALYRDTLALRVAGEAENHGPEQEHLNNVFGARLRITALRAAAGPGIELLDYLAPRDGRPAPDDLRSNDVLHWQIRLGSPGLDEAAGALRRSAVRQVSPGVVAAPLELGFVRGLLLRDADGHALELVQR
jgi:catechol 2,3-dioxygenase-like lactoylglutathione lyase family enzyme